MLSHPEHNCGDLFCLERRLLEGNHKSIKPALVWLWGYLPVVLVILLNAGCPSHIAKQVVLVIMRNAGCPSHIAKCRSTRLQNRSVVSLSIEVDGEAVKGVHKLHLPRQHAYIVDKRDILERMKSLKWQWAGHTARRSDDIWTTAVMDWIPRDLKRSRGRPPDRGDRDIRSVVGVDWKNIAQDRLAWKELETTYVTLNCKVCKSCSSVISGSLHQEPNENRHVLINFKYTGPFVDCSTGSKRILKGTRRRSALEELVEKNVSAYTVRREESRKSMHLGDNEPSHIPTLNALRLAKSRELKSRCVDNDLILAVGKLKYSAEYYSSIREIGLDPFHVYYWTPAQLCVYQEYCKNHPFPTVASDATGGITEKLKRPFGNVSGVVYINSVVVHDHEAGVQYTVANMLSESHNNLRIHNFLESWLRSGPPVPKEAVCDHSVALLSGLVKSFTQFASLSEYLGNCYENLFHCSSLISNCFVRCDVAHTLKLITSLPPLHGKPRRFRNFYIRNLALVVQCQNTVEVKHSLECIFHVALSKTEGTSASTEEITQCEKAKTTLKNLFATGLNASLQSAIDTILDEDNCYRTAQLL
ncbi:hypothetical protein PR048_015017 [Dryococelus australis]|uniref:Uncharacterized protein n=1 Tax=Dryococelus australis TaxID=614101 RepID=A0ABQ9HG02_9NEOP|nr:hypothetical protein PR048_015017 [Dryococelus australis]